MARIAARHEVDVSHITSSFAHGQASLTALQSALREQFPPDSVPGFELLITGSIAKRQCTRGSDIDFFGVAEEELPADRTEPIIAAVLHQALAMGFDVPYAQGPGAAIVPRAEIETIHFTDDIRRVFRRMMLVTASASGYRPELRASMLRAVLAGLVGRERSPRVRGLVDHLIQLNRLGNIASEARMSDRNADGGLVHWAKAFTLYRVEFAGSLAAAFRAEASCANSDDLIEELASRFDQLPLLRLLEWYDDVGDEGKQALADIVAVSNDCLRLFAMEGARPRLAANQDDEPTRALREAFEEQMSRIGGALVRLFHREPALRPWTEELGLFG